MLERFMVLVGKGSGMFDGWACVRGSGVLRGYIISNKALGGS
jgi:hypothetical protein